MTIKYLIPLSLFIILLSIIRCTSCHNDCEECLCNDEKLNGNEEYIDCGGDCELCVEILNAEWDYPIIDNQGETILKNSLYIYILDTVNFVDTSFKCYFMES